MGLIATGEHQSNCQKVIFMATDQTSMRDELVADNRLELCIGLLALVFYIIPRLALRELMWTIFGLPHER